MKKIFIATALFLSTGILANAKTGISSTPVKSEVKDKKNLGSGDDKKNLGSGDARLAFDKKNLGSGDDKKNLGSGDDKKNLGSGDARLA